jgi:putative transcriptional regulator
VRKANYPHGLSFLFILREGKQILTRGGFMNPKLLRFIRQSQGLSQQEMANRLGISKTLVCLIENNKKNISEKVSKRFREEFGSELIDKCRVFLGEK